MPTANPINGQCQPNRIVAPSSTTERRPQRHQHRVVQQVEGPHAARELAHRGAGEAVGVPVGGKALDAPEGLVRHLAHHAQGEAHDALEQPIAQRHQGDAEADNGRNALSASSTAASRVRAMSAKASIMCPANSGTASSAAAISIMPAAMTEARRHCRPPAAGDESDRADERVFASLGSARSHCSMPRPRKGDGPEKIVRPKAG